MASTVTSTSPPYRPDRTLKRAVVLIALIVLLLVVAVWKPWGTGTGTIRSTVPPGASGSLLPAITGEPGSEASPGGS